ncbi:muts domain V-domain-containing protein [Peziza echinospora]|nr:muts domain V-domain-containing protein [Peziza echinospora]
MAPAPAKSPAAASKQQRTISSFFTPKPATSTANANANAKPAAVAAKPKPKPVVKGKKAAAAAAAGSSARKPRAVVQEEEEEEEPEVESAEEEEEEDEYKEDGGDGDGDGEGGVVRPRRSTSRRSGAATNTSTRTPSTSVPPPPPPPQKKRQLGSVGEEVGEDSEDDGAVSKKKKKLRRSSGSAVGGGGGDGDEEMRDVEMEEDIPRMLKRTSVSATYNTPSSTGTPTTLGSRKKAKEVAKEKTSRFMYNPSGTQGGAGGGSSVSAAKHGEEEEEEEEDEEYKRQKEKLHEKFIQKLGKATALDDIARRNKVFDGNGGGEEGGEDDEFAAEEEEEEEAPKGRGKKGGKAAAAAGKKWKSKLTPLEKQVVDIKLKNPDTVLVVEVGYKFRFFGEDARTASKELSIMCIPGKMRFDEHPSEAHLDKFASASIPVHRLHVHVKRLVAAGHKVGIVRQLETAALKAVGDNRNAPFTRKLTNLYTKGTYVDDVDGFDDIAGVGSSAPATGYLLCLTEVPMGGMGTDERVNVGIIAVQPSTGDVIYDEFSDGFMRSEIETRLLHIAPCELLIVGELSKATDKLVTHLAGSTTSVFGDKIRVERVEKSKTMTATAASHVSKFYGDKAKDKNKSTKPGDNHSTDLLDSVINFPDLVTICLSAMITHMESYGLEHVFDLTKYFQSFSTRSHMLLNGNTLSSLEVYHNQTDYTEKGSLFWALDRTKTKFGRRLLRKWVGRPLLDKKELEERVEAVEEIKEGQNNQMMKLRDLFARTSFDLEKGLIRIYYGKCTRPEILSVLQTMNTIATTFPKVEDTSKAGFKSNILNTCIASLPLIAEDVAEFLDRFNHTAASKDDKYNFFRNEESDHEAIYEKKMGIVAVEQDLQDQLPVISNILKKKKPIQFVTVSQIEYLVEVENTKEALKLVPASWMKISGTKKVSRFHTPEVVKLMAERDQLKESLAAECDYAFKAFLEEISGKYQQLRDAVQALATLDCLCSLATVARLPGYVKPVYIDEAAIHVEEGRHPMVEQLLTDAYVPNDIHLSSSPEQDSGVSTTTTTTTSEVSEPPSSPRAILITGPNMGGKSSYVRSVALISIMGQIGSYVPAQSARLGMLDAIFTRMGAHDNMLAGESTFMVELSETSDILKQATPRSLVILDELGRGTSTHDGVAIADAVLEYVVRDIRALTLFVTHYPLLARFGEKFPGVVRCAHMAFEEFEVPAARTDEREGGMDLDEEEEEGETATAPSQAQPEKQITFLYKLATGVAHRSYGLNVARLAGVPQKCLVVAAVKSRQLEEALREREVERLAFIMQQVLTATDTGTDTSPANEDGFSNSDPRYLLERIDALEVPL